MGNTFDFSSHVFVHVFLAFAFKYLLTMRAWDQIHEAPPQQNWRETWTKSKSQNSKENFWRWLKGFEIGDLHFRILFGNIFHQCCTLCFFQPGHFYKISKFPPESTISCGTPLPDHSHWLAVPYGVLNPSKPRGWFWRIESYGGGVDEVHFECFIDV